MPPRPERVQERFGRQPPSEQPPQSQDGGDDQPAQEGPQEEGQVRERQAPQPPPGPSVAKAHAAPHAALLKASLRGLVPGLDAEGAAKLAEHLAALTASASEEELGAVLEACRQGRR
jgi:hypothetical protein